LRAGLMMFAGVGELPGMAGPRSGRAPSVSRAHRSGRISAHRRPRQTRGFARSRSCLPRSNIAVSASKWRCGSTVPVPPC
jgi:hypothetical protein